MIPVALDRSVLAVVRERAIVVGERGGIVLTSVRRVSTTVGDTVDSEAGLYTVLMSVRSLLYSLLSPSLREIPGHIFITLA